MFFRVTSVRGPLAGIFPWYSILPGGLRIPFRQMPVFSCVYEPFPNSSGGGVFPREMGIRLVSFFCDDWNIGFLLPLWGNFRRIPAEFFRLVCFLFPSICKIFGPIEIRPDMSFGRTSDGKRAVSPAVGYPYRKIRVFFPSVPAIGAASMFLCFSGFPPQEKGRAPLAAAPARRYRLENAACLLIFGWRSGRRGRKKIFAGGKPFSGLIRHSV